MYGSATAMETTSREVNRGTLQVSPGRSPAGPFPFEDPRGSTARWAYEDQHLQVFSGGQREIDASRKRANEAEQALLARTRTLEEVQKVAEVKDLELKVISWTYLELP
jgi:hypothetical protein